MKPDSVPRQQTTVRSEAETTAASVTSSAGVEFQSPEEMLRYDREQTVVPEALAQRVADSAPSVVPPAKPWWRRWF